MEVKKTLNIPSPPVEYIASGPFLYVLSPYKSSGQLLTLDVNTLESVGSFWVQGQEPSKMALNDDYVYIITADGLQSYDSFSGDPIVYMATGSCLPLSVVVDNDKVFSLCGIPLVNKMQVNTNYTCVCLNDSESGRKVAQSQSIQGRYHPLTYSDDIWVTGESVSYQFDTTCQLKHKRPLQVFPDYPVILTDNYAVMASSLGTLEIFDRKDIAQTSRMLVEKNDTSPVSCGNDQLVWATDEDIYIINLSDLKSEKLSPLGGKVQSPPIIYEDHAYFCDESGGLTQVNLQTGENERLKLSKNALQQPVLAENGNLFIVSNTEFYQVDIK